MSEQLLETARAVRRGGRAVVRVLSGRIGSRPVQFKDPLTRVLKECLPGYWQVEGTIIEHYAKASGLLRGGADRSPGVAAELVVLRRK
jgi:hypothetical protein